MNYRHVLAVAGKELQLFFKDRGSMLVFFLMPLLFASFFGQMGRTLGEEEGAPEVKVPIAIVNEDEGAFAARVVEALQEIPVLVPQMSASAQEAGDLVGEGEVSAAILFPADFSSSIDAHEPTEVRIIVDPVQPEAASIVRGILNQVATESTLWGEVLFGIRSVMDEAGILSGAPAAMRQAAEMQTLGVIMTTLDEARQNPVITVRSEDLSGAATPEPWDPFSFNMPAMFTMFAFFMIGTVATGILSEKESGAFRRLLSSPIHPGAIIAGKILAYMLIILLQATIMFTVARLLFGMNLGRSPVGLALLTILLAFVATSLGLLLATLARSSQQADSLGVIVPLVLAGLGGCIAFGELFFRAQGTAMYYISNATPHAHAMEGYLRLLLDDGTLVDILPQLGMLAGFGVVFFVLAMLRFRFES